MQNLANTQKQQGLAAQVAAATGGAAVNQFAHDMANLTPAAQKVVNQLLGMKSAVHGLSAVAQSAILPGFSASWRRSRTCCRSCQPRSGRWAGSWAACWPTLAGRSSRPGSSGT